MIVGKGFEVIVNEVAATASTRSVGVASSAASSGLSLSANLTSMSHVPRFEYTRANLLCIWHFRCLIGVRLLERRTLERSVTHTSVMQRCEGFLELDTLFRNWSLLVMAFPYHYTTTI